MHIIKTLLINTLNFYLIIIKMKFILNLTILFYLSMILIAKVYLYKI